ncbi:hypothetical protein [Streptomyces bacillaris]|uniref:hypothetical protein n=1 Tax=Streptomyces bacillaris TaxID=68179 RepID=UPI0037FAD8E0
MSRTTLPADITGAIDNLVKTIRSTTTPNEAGLRTALEGLVQAGVTLGESRQSASLQLPTADGQQMEIRSRPGAPAGDDEDDQPLPPNACRAVFNAPRLARDARTLRPCHLERDHPGKHTNSRGVTWSSRNTSRTKTTRSDSPMNTADLKARTARIAAQMKRSAAPARRSSSTPYRPSGPLAAARRTVDLSRQDVPSQGWMPSQIAVGMRALEQAGEAVLRIASADPDVAFAYRTQAGALRRKLLEVHALSLPGADTSTLRQKDIDGMAAAVNDLLVPLEARQKANEQWARQLARGAELADQPRPQPTPHPWAAAAYGGDAA